MMKLNIRSVLLETLNVTVGAVEYEHEMHTEDRAAPTLQDTIEVGDRL